MLSPSQSGRQLCLSLWSSHSGIFYKAPPTLRLWPFRSWQGLMCNCWSQLVSCKFLTSGNGEEQQLGGQLRTVEPYDWKVKQSKRSGSSRKMQRHTFRWSVSRHMLHSLAIAHTEWKVVRTLLPQTVLLPSPSPPLVPAQSWLNHAMALHCHGDPPPHCGRAQGLKEEERGVAGQEVTWVSWSWCCFSRFPGPRRAWWGLGISWTIKKILRRRDVWANPNGEGRPWDLESWTWVLTSSMVYRLAL